MKYRIPVFALILTRLTEADNSIAFFVYLERKFSMYIRETNLKKNYSKLYF